MSTISHGPSALPERPTWSMRLLVPEFWAALAIAMMWLAVLFTAIFGPDIVTSSSSGDNARVPSAIAVSFFAFLGTWAVAKYALRRPRD